MSEPEICRASRGQGTGDKSAGSGSGISERRVEQVVDVPARQVVEVSQFPGDTVETVELRKKFFEENIDRDECQAA